MKIIKTILKITLVLFALVCVFVLVCAFRPDVTEKVAAFLYTDSPGPVLQKKEAGQVTAVFGEKEDNGSISFESRQIEEEEAGELEEQVGMGNRGEEISFDPEFYPYYAMLDERGQCLYRQIYANACELIQNFVPAEPVQVGELQDIFSAVYNDHPELFFVETAYFCKYKANGQCAELELSFNSLAGELDEAREKFQAETDAILAEAENFSTPADKERFVHDTLVGRVEYDSQAEKGQSAYSALVEGRTVCAGYTKAFQYLMQQLGIPCYYCTGYTDENHAWNIVALEDGFYHVDLTFADTEKGICYDYYNRTDGDYAGTHMRRGLAAKLPACNGQMFRPV